MPSEELPVSTVNILRYILFVYNAWTEPYDKYNDYFQ